MKKTLVKYAILFSVIVVIGICLFISFLIITFPIIISYATGNWWYMFLYFVVPMLLPAILFLAQVLVAFLEFISGKYHE